MKKRHSFLARAAMMLLLAVFTTMTAWATNATPLTSTEGLKLVPGLSATGSNNYHSWETEYRKLFDGEASTSWHYYKGSGTIWEENGHTIWGTYVEFQSASACIPVGYRLTTSNSAAEHPEWNPTSWRLMAKANSSDAWTTLAEASEDHTLEAKNCQPYNFAIAGNTTAYKYFRFEMTKPDNLELAELNLWEAIDPNEPKYAINLPTNLTHGTIDALVDGTSCTEAYQGDRVNIRVTWSEGYDLARDEFSIEDADGNEVNLDELWRESGDYYRTYAFTMPASSVTVNANIDVKRYQIDSPSYGDDGKTFSISPRKAVANETVTLTITKLKDVLIDNIVAWYNQDSGGGKEAPLHRMRGDDSAKDDGRVILELTKVDETHYTFLMPATEVYIATDLHYEGKYGVRAASGMDDESLVVSMDNISAVAANAGDELWVSFNTDGVENLTIAGETTTLTVGNGISAVTGTGTFTIQFACTPQADNKRQCFISQYDKDAAMGIGIEHNSGSVTDGRFRIYSRKYDKYVFSSSTSSLPWYVHVMNTFCAALNSASARSATAAKNALFVTPSSIWICSTFSAIFVFSIVLALCLPEAQRR